MSAASQMLEIPAVGASISRIAVAQYHPIADFNENTVRIRLMAFLG